jgi:ATP-dependent 26S proteasome regulatory subunit
MPEVLPESPQVNDSAAPYASNREHLCDELKRLDLLIRALLRREQGREPAGLPANLLEQLHGLVLTEEEVVRLLSDKDEREPDGEWAGREDTALGEAYGEIEKQIAQRSAASYQEKQFLALPFLARLFGLGAFERQCLVICLAPELERKYEKLYAYLQDDVTRRKPSVALTLDLLCRTLPEKIAARAAFDGQSPLLKYRLVQITDSAPDGPTPLLGRYLKLDDRIVDFLLSHQEPARFLDARLASCARLEFPETEWEQALIAEDVRLRTQQFVRAHINQKESDARDLVFYFYGPYGAGKHALARAVCHDLGAPLLFGNVEKMLNSGGSFEEGAWLLGREAALQGAALCLENFDCLLAEEEKNHEQLRALAQAAQTFSSLTFLFGRKAWKPRGAMDGQMFIDLSLPIPDERARKEFWLRQCAGPGQLAATAPEDADWSALAGKFRFTPGQIRDAVSTARSLAAWRAPDDRRLTMADLYAACRANSNQKLSALAQKIQPKYAWDDIILPADRLQQLREICNYVKYRALVYQEWGFDSKLSLGKGLNVLFAGPSGTGKTMSAEIMAGELGLDLYKIDLSTVVSKYIGETEKNLARIFDEAETSNAILFFDEADALFGRRSEVRDSHDRYANIEIGYLLQKMEEYQGMVILATNFRKNMDDAFVRRMHFTVEFPFPGEDDRQRIWERIWPESAPVSQDLNLEFLARRFEVAGGAIRNIALAAAFLAAADGRVVTMSHLIRATRREYQKMGKVVTEGEFGEYAGLAEMR